MMAFLLAERNAFWLASDFPLGVMLRISRSDRIRLG
jgi:hypothetical protein